MAQDAKKHTTIAPGEKPTQAALAASILSINDVVPVATAVEQAQVAAANAPSSTKPLSTLRGDARGLHRLEYIYDAAGDVPIPASGLLAFGSKLAADTWAASNSALLTAGDSCMVAGVEYRWSGTAWYVENGAVIPTSAVGGTVGAGGVVTFTGAGQVSVNGAFTSAPENYLVVVDVDSASAAVYYRIRLRAAGADLATAAYSEYYAIHASATPTYDYSLVRTSMIVGYTDATSLSKSHAEVQISGPALTGHTWTPMQSRGVSQERMVISGGGARVNGIYDGFTLIPDSGAGFSGRIRIFAQPNN
jgi:hypothetical protein